MKTFRLLTGSTEEHIIVGQEALDVSLPSKAILILQQTLTLPSIITNTHRIAGLGPSSIMKSNVLTIKDSELARATPLKLGRLGETKQYLRYREEAFYTY